MDTISGFVMVVVRETYNLFAYLGLLVMTL